MAPIKAKSKKPKKSKPASSKAKAKDKGKSAEKARLRRIKRSHAAAEDKAKLRASCSKQDPSQRLLAFSSQKPSVASMHAVERARRVRTLGSDNVRARKQGKYNQYQVRNPERGTWVVCSGLIPTLRASIMPWLPLYHRNHAVKAWNKKYSKKGSGSSRADGKRVDAEVFHVVECVLGQKVPELGFGFDLRDLPSGGIVPGLWHAKTRAPLNPPLCPGCGLKGRKYTHATPKWHTHTLNYLRDVARLGITLVASQVVVADLANRVGTELDDLGVLPDGRMIVLERKAGYQSMSAKPPRTAITKSVELNTTPTPLLLANTEHTLHRLQGAVGGALATKAWRRHAPCLAMTSVVVYVSGNTNAPHKHARALRLNLDCDWVFEDEVPEGERVDADKAAQILDNIRTAY